MTIIEIGLRKTVKFVGSVVSKNRYTVASVFLIFIGVFIDKWVVGWANASDLKTFPFISSVWGDTANWATFGVSIATVALLYATFRSQRKMQVYSQVQTAVLLLDTIPKIMPILSVGEASQPFMQLHGVSRSSDSINVELEGFLTNTGNDAYNVRWESNDHIHSLGEPNGAQNLDVWSKNDLRFFNIMARGVPVEKVNNLVVYKITFYFEDKLKNQYKQILRITNTFHPEIIATGPPGNGGPSPQPPKIGEADFKFEEPVLFKHYFPVF